MYKKKTKRVSKLNLSLRLDNKRHKEFNFGLSKQNLSYLGSITKVNTNKEVSSFKKLEFSLPTKNTSVFNIQGSAHKEVINIQKNNNIILDFNATPGYWMLVNNNLPKALPWGYTQPDLTLGAFIKIFCGVFLRAGKLRELLKVLSFVSFESPLALELKAFPKPIDPSEVTKLKEVTDIKIKTSIGLNDIKRDKVRRASLYKLASPRYHNSNPLVIRFNKKAALSLRLRLLKKKLMLKLKLKKFIILYKKIFKKSKRKLPVTKTLHFSFFKKDTALVTRTKSLVFKKNWVCLFKKEDIKKKKKFYILKSYNKILNFKGKTKSSLNRLLKKTLIRSAISPYLSNRMIIKKKRSMLNLVLRLLITLWLRERAFFEKKKKIIRKKMGFLTLINFGRYLKAVRGLNRVTLKFFKKKKYGAFQVRRLEKLIFLNTLRGLIQFVAKKLGRFNVASFNYKLRIRVYKRHLRLKALKKKKNKIDKTKTSAITTKKNKRPRLFWLRYPPKTKKVKIIKKKKLYKKVFSILKFKKLINFFFKKKVLKQLNTFDTLNIKENLLMSEKEKKKKRELYLKKKKIKKVVPFLPFSAAKKKPIEKINTKINFLPEAKSSIFKIHFLLKNKSRLPWSKLIKIKSNLFKKQSRRLTVNSIGGQLLNPNKVHFMFLSKKKIKPINNLKRPELKKVLKVRPLRLLSYEDTKLILSKGKGNKRTKKVKNINSVNFYFLKILRSLKKYKAKDKTKEKIFKRILNVFKKQDFMCIKKVSLLSNLIIRNLKPITRGGTFRPYKLKTCVKKIATNLTTSKVYAKSGISLVKTLIVTNTLKEPEHIRPLFWSKLKDQPVLNYCLKYCRLSRRVRKILKNKYRYSKYFFMIIPAKRQLYTLHLWKYILKFHDERTFKERLGNLMNNFNKENLNSLDSLLWTLFYSQQRMALKRLLGR